LALGGRIRDHQGTQILSRRAVPHVAVPTTAGTGSEVSVYAVIKDEQAQEKLHFMDDRLIPDTAVLDPKLTASLPPFLTAATGFDALSHAVEAYTSRNAGPIADAHALHAVRFIGQTLVRAVEHGEDLDARADMLVAANLAGAAMSNAGVGLAHAIAHVLGARHGLHHGTANATVLPHVIRFNADELGERYRVLGQAMRADDLATACAALLARCGLPVRLRDVPVLSDDLPGIAEAAVADGAIAYNGKFAGDPDLVRGVLEAAW
jgi:alcohol dehydrogenase